MTIIQKICVLSCCHTSRFNRSWLSPDVGYDQDLIYEMCKQFQLDVTFGIVKGRSESSCDLLWTGPWFCNLLCKHWTAALYLSTKCIYLLNDLQSHSFSDRNFKADSFNPSEVCKRHVAYSMLNSIFWVGDQGTSLHLCWLSLKNWCRSLCTSPKLPVTFTNLSLIHPGSLEAGPDREAFGPWGTNPDV